VVVEAWQVSGKRFGKESRFSAAKRHTAARIPPGSGSRDGCEVVPRCVHSKKDYMISERALAVLRLTMPVKDEDKVDGSRHVAAEAAASVPILQLDAPPSEASGGTTLNKP